MPQRLKIRNGTLRLKVDILLSKTSKYWSKRLTDGKLKTLCLVVESHGVAGIGIQRYPIREAEQAQRRKPLHRDPGRSLQVIITEMVIYGRNVVFAKEFYSIPGLEYVAHIVEPADAGGAPPLLRLGEDQFQSADHAKVAAVWVADADVVARSQGAFSETANAVRTAGEIIEVGRQGCGFPERRCVVHARVVRQQPLAP